MIEDAVSKITQKGGMLKYTYESAIDAASDKFSKAFIRAYGVKGKEMIDIYHKAQRE